MTGIAQWRHETISFCQKNAGLPICFVRSSQQSMYVSSQVIILSLYSLMMNSAQAISWCHHVIMSVYVNFASVETLFCLIISSRHFMLEFLGCSFSLLLYMGFIFLSTFVSGVGAAYLSAECAVQSVQF
jgi:hypothetical protein